MDRQTSIGCVLAAAILALSGCGPFPWGPGQIDKGASEVDRDVRSNPVRKPELTSQPAEPRDVALQRAFQENGPRGIREAAKNIEQADGTGAAIEALSRLLEHENTRLSAAAAHALGSLGDAGKATLDKVVHALSDYPVMHYLNEFGAGDIPLWLAEAALQPHLTPDGAFLCLQMLPTKDERLVPLFVKALDHPHLDVRWDAVVLLADMGERAAPAYATLVRLLEGEPNRRQQADEHFSPDQVRQQAAFALGCIGVEPERTVPLLMKMLRHENPGIRIWSALGLGRMGADAKTAIPELIELLANDEFALPPADCIMSAHPEHAASTALVNIGKDALPGLVQALNEHEPRVRSRAAEALMYFGPEAESATNDLIRLLQDHDEEVRCQAVAALSWVAPKDQRLVAEMVRLTQANESRVRAAALTTLSVVGRDQKIPLAPVLRRLKDPEPHVRVTALECLEATAPRETVESAVKLLLVDPDDNVRYVAEQAQERLQEDRSP